MSTHTSDELTAPPGSLPGDNAAFKLTLERQMHAMVSELEYLIAKHDQWGDTIQKTSLYKARAALKGGLDWFDWERKRALEKQA